MSPRVIVFDVNETLLDLSALDHHFQHAFGNAVARQEWFAQLLRSAMIATLTNTYHDFTTLAGAALDMVAARREVRLSANTRAGILDQMRHLPPHPEVQVSLERLHDAGLRLAALTNSAPAAAEAQLSNAGLKEFFEQIISVDAVKRYKPAPEPYRWAAERLGVNIGDMRLVAAHDWDVAGAMKAGCKAAFVARPGMVLNPLMPQPDIIGKDLAEVTQRLLEIDARDER